MKAKLLKKVKSEIFVTKVRRFGFEMFKISSKISGADNGVYCISIDVAVEILREMRLEAARNAMPRKEERRLRL